MSYEPRLTIKTAENSKLEMSPITMLHSNQSDVQPANSQLEPEVSSSFKTEELSAALRSAESRIKQNPSDPEALATLGSCYLQFNELDTALRIYKELITVQPNNSEAHYNLGIVLGKLNKYDQAILANQQAIRLNDNHANAYNALGVLLMKLERHDQAVDAFRNAIERDKKSAITFHNLGVAISEGVKLNKNINTEEAISAFRNAISIKPHFPKARNNLAKLHLEQHEFEHGFKLAESRWEANNWELPKSDKPVWEGQSGRKVLVWPEQGIGDEIMFASTLSDLSEVSQKVLLLADPRLVSLYSRSFGASVEVLPKDTNVHQIDYDHHISIGSLPKFFRKQTIDFKTAASGFLKADRGTSRQLRQILKTNSHKKIIGLSWHTNSKIPHAYKRNIDFITLVMNLLSVDATFVSLQYGNHTREIEELCDSTGITINQPKGIDNFKDLDRFSALISACDEVVTIDNSTAHFAGGLGVTTRLLLPIFSDWRWGQFDKTSYWYDSVSIYRQKIPGLWDDPLQQVSKALRNS